MKYASSFQTSLYKLIKIQYTFSSGKKVSEPENFQSFSVENCNLVKGIRFISKVRTSGRAYIEIVFNTSNSKSLVLFSCVDCTGDSGQNVEKGLTSSNSQKTR